MIAITHAPSKRLQHCQLTHIAPQPIDFERAVGQHDAYCQMLRELDVEVITLDVNRELPDSVFVEDTAIVLDEIAIITPMGTESRRDEPVGIESELTKHREIQRIEFPASMEGGDALRIGRRLLVGVSSRTNSAGIRELERIVRPIGYKILPVTVGGCLHLKSACTAFPDGRLLVNQNWLDVDALSDFEIVSVPAEEPSAANMLLVRDTVCIAAEHQRTAEIVFNLGFDLRTLDISELAKAEGAMTCPSLIFRDHRR